MTSCPECFSAQIESLLTMRDDRQDDEHAVSISKFRCLSCGCEFEVTERTEWETEVTKHGSEVKRCRWCARLKFPDNKRTGVNAVGADCELGLREDDGSAETCREFTKAEA